MMRNKLATAVAAMAFGVSAQAVPIFADNFDADATGLNQAPTGWTVSSGTVDVVGNGVDDRVPGNGVYIDLDGTTSLAGLLTSPSLNLTAGLTYTATFDLAGSQLGSTETGVVTFGSQSLNYSLASAAPFTTFSLSFTPSTSGAYALSFHNDGGDDVGALLDNVVVNQVTVPVPEPETYALLLAGLAVLGAVSWRRRPSA